ncbi:hypothetical protein EJ08DRAFT_672848 [Tothia fuscella]|uniref:Altered inheritance of mitochondria protein 9, mitochondrial n=1 Tax=Tothia fuscella TaxID=1048955 RepID=A0A9P4TUG3_9PEZI|nr:hypothetical protein EJ08DRAFT_672848 [Tothia fuscella]
MLVDLGIDIGCRRPGAHTRKGLKSIVLADLFNYTNGRFLTNEELCLKRRFVESDVRKLCEVILELTSNGAARSPVISIDKLEGGFSKVLVIKQADGTEVTAKIPTPFAGPPCLTTESEVAVLRFVKSKTSIPVPGVLAWSSNPNNPLFHRWGSLDRPDRFSLIKQLTKLEAELTALVLPSNGHLYLRSSLPAGFPSLNVDLSINSDYHYCLGPSCDRTWSSQNERSNSSLNRGLVRHFRWTSAAAYGIALAEREVYRIEAASDVRPTEFGTPNNADDIQLLRTTIKLIQHIQSSSILQTSIEPTIWHTDLHLGNIFVSEDSPPKIVSLIDWQSIPISPPFLQARWPVFLDPPDDYPEGLGKPQLPDNYNNLDDEEKKLADFKLSEINQSKGYEISTFLSNKRAHRAMTLPRVFKELFIRTGEAYEEGTIALRECLLEIRSNWTELGFNGTCVYSFTDAEIERHKQQFSEYLEWHGLRKVLRDALCTDAEGWVSPELDFEAIKRSNRELFEVFVEKYDGLKTREECLRIWPYAEAL